MPVTVVESLGRSRSICRNIVQHEGRGFSWEFRAAQRCCTVRRQQEKPSEVKGVESVGFVLTRFPVVFRGSRVSIAVCWNDKAADDCTFPGYQGRLPTWQMVEFRASRSSALLDEITPLLSGRTGSSLSAFQGGKFSGCPCTALLGDFHPGCSGTQGEQSCSAELICSPH